jgi:hypothetical protein
VTKSQVLLIGNESVGEERRIRGEMGEDVLYTGAATGSTKNS